MSKALDKEAVKQRVRELLCQAGAPVHLVGIGGIGMAGLAVQLAHRGLAVSGCDAAGSRILAWLGERGIPVVAGHGRAHVTGARAIIRSAAVSDQEDEIQCALGRGLPVFQRGQILPVLLEGRFSVAVAGTHGKTTTTAMIAQIFRAAGRDPSYCVGGEWEGGRGMAGVGGGGDLIVEADESDGTLALYAPEVAVLTNVEFDHMEHFKTEEALAACFDAFLGQARRAVVYCADDPRARRLAAKRPGALSYGFAGDAMIQGAEVSLSAEASRCVVLREGRPAGEICLPVPGRYNLQNALGACSAAVASEIPLAVACEALQSFQPVRRRFEQYGNSRGWRIISDYAHHPTEIRAFVQAALLLKPARLMAVFQPHRYSRTKALGPEFPAAFAGVDELLLAPVYAASEKPLPGGTTEDLLAHFEKGSSQKVEAVDSLEDAWAKVRERMQNDGLLLVVGAGDVEKIVQWAAEA